MEIKRDLVCHDGYVYKLNYLVRAAQIPVN